MNWFDSMVYEALKNKRRGYFRFGNVEVVFTPRGAVKWRTLPGKTWRYDAELRAQNRRRLQDEMKRTAMLKPEAR